MSNEQPRHMAQPRFKAVAVLRGTRTPAAALCADDQRHLRLPAAHVAHFGDLIHHRIHGVKHEINTRVHHNRLHSSQRSTHARTGTGQLRHRRIDDALNAADFAHGHEAEVFGQALPLRDVGRIARLDQAFEKPVLGAWRGQDVEAVFPELVTQWKLSDDCQDALSVNYEKLVPVLLAAIQELTAEVEELKSRPCPAKES